MLAGFQVSAAGVASSEVLVPTTDSDDRTAHQVVPTGIRVSRSQHRLDSGDWARVLHQWHHDGTLLHLLYKCMDFENVQ